MAGKALCAILAFSAAIAGAMAVGMVNTIRVPTGPCAPSIEPTGATTYCSTSRPGVPLNTNSVELSASPSFSTQSLSAPAATLIFPAYQYLFEIRSLSSPTSRVVDKKKAYLAAGGMQTSNCGQGEIFSLQDNALSSDGLWVSASPNTSWARFAVSAPTGVMTTSFMLSDGYLTWTNPAFSGGLASFCAVNGTIIAVFSDTVPADCIAVKLLAITAGM